MIDAGTPGLKPRAASPRLSGVRSGFCSPRSLAAVKQARKAELHTLFLSELPASDDRLSIEGDEASHALRSKRLGPGEMVRVIDGRGTVLVAEVLEARRSLVLRVTERRVEERASPAVHVWSATPKGPRIAELVEGLVQAGAASWTPMQTKLGVVDPRESKLERMERVVIEASKQSGRAWLMEVRDKRTFADALRVHGTGESLVLADAGGEAYRSVASGGVRVLIGPEGGFTKDEVDAARSAGARIVNFGPHTMRIETAAAVATAIVMNEGR